MVEIIAPSHVAYGVEVRNKAESLALFTSEALRLGLAKDEESVLAAYRLREEEGTTGLIDGFSVPHAKSAAIVRPAVLVQTLSEPIED